MKMIISGGFILFSGVILYIGVHIPAALHAENISGWYTPPGRYGTALEETGGTIGMIISVAMCILGMALLMWGAFRVNDRRNEL